MERACWALLLLLATLGTDPAAAGSAGYENALHRRLLRDLADGRLDEHRLITAAILAGGSCDRQRLQHLQDRYERFVRRVRETQPAGRSDRAVHLLSMLHKRILVGGYDVSASGVDQALAAGRYNCLAATILYRAAAAELEIDAHCVRQGDHVWVQIELEQRSLRIETTRAEGVELPNGTTPCEPATNGQVADRLNDAQLLALGYYNRGIELASRGHFAEAAAATAIAAALNPDDVAARENLLSTANQWSIELAAAARHGESRRLLNAALALRPHDAALLANQARIEAALSEEEPRSITRSARSPR